MLKKILCVMVVLVMVIAVAGFSMNSSAEMSGEISDAGIASGEAAASGITEEDLEAYVLLNDVYMIQMSEADWSQVTAEAAEVGTEVVPTNAEPQGEIQTLQLLWEEVVDYTASDPLGLQDTIAIYDKDVVTDVAIDWGDLDGSVIGTYDLVFTVTVDVDELTEALARSGALGMVTDFPCSMEVNASYPVKAGPGSEYDAIGTAEMGLDLTVTGSEGEWYIVDFDGQTGYIPASYLSPATSATTGSNADHEMQEVVITKSVYVMSEEDYADLLSETTITEVSEGIAVLRRLDQTMWR